MEAGGRDTAWGHGGRVGLRGSSGLVYGFICLACSPGKLQSASHSSSRPLTADRGNPRHHASATNLTVALVFDKYLPLHSMVARRHLRQPEPRLPLSNETPASRKAHAGATRGEMGARAGPDATWGASGDLWRSDADELYGFGEWTDSGVGGSLIWRGTYTMCGREGTRDRKGRVWCTHLFGVGRPGTARCGLFIELVKYDGADYDLCLHGVSVAAIPIAPSPRSKVMNTSRKEPTT